MNRLMKKMLKLGVSVGGVTAIIAAGSAVSGITGKLYNKIDNIGVQTEEPEEENEELETTDEDEEAE